jgi:hypothetical protein
VSEEPEINITPEMISAGLSELACYDWGESEEEYVVRIYRAMESERRSPPAKQQASED